MMAKLSMLLPHLSSYSMLKVITVVITNNYSHDVELSVSDV